MAYDRMDWHYGGDFPEGLPEENGGTHIGMFLAWAIETKLIGEFHQEESEESIRQILKREITGREFLEDMCDEKFWEEDLNEEGNNFAKAYYEEDTSFGDKFSSYMEDYSTLFKKYETVYHVEDTWVNYDLIKPIIDQRFKQWKETN